MNKKSAYFTELWRSGYGKSSFFTLFLSIGLMIIGGTIYLVKSQGFPFLYPLILVFGALLSYVLFLIIIQLREISLIVHLVFIVIPLVIDTICLVTFIAFIDVHWLIIFLFSTSTLTFIVAFVFTILSFKKIEI
ncbi:MAG: hypothetical protein H7647_02805 [Candidatus Heimdallarchaeota archaeon]|nr:hypothetical protein [Candidatus Heimdallarchaeota archaeon]MCK4253359.1 hypothetical protein [Candidatus Heimdallarchaeota archaeon]